MKALFPGQNVTNTSDLKIELCLGMGAASDRLHKAKLPLLLDSRKEGSRMKRRTKKALEIAPLVLKLIVAVLQLITIILSFL